MGAAKVGKSSIITQFLYGTFSPKYKRTVEEMHHGHFSVGGVNLTLDILDTSGSYEVGDGMGGGQVIEGNLRARLIGKYSSSISLRYSICFLKGINLTYK